MILCAACLHAYDLTFCFVVVRRLSLQLYYEALCPSCQDFIKGPLNDVMNMPDIVAISDFKLVPYVRTGICALI